MAKAIKLADENGVLTAVVPYYFVGQIIMSTKSANPSTYLGYGTWEAVLTNRFPVGAGDTYSLGSTGGEATHTLTTDEMPSHQHRILGGYGSGTLGDGYFRVDTNNPLVEWNKTMATGGGKAHNNLPPYQAVYFWERTA